MGTTQLTDCKLGDLAKQVCRESNFTLQKGIVREPSFIYDTTVEGFGAKGASIDDLDVCGYKLVEEATTESEAPVVSIIGRIAGEIDKDSVDPFGVGAESLHLSGDFDFNDIDTGVSSSEKPDCVCYEKETFYSTTGLCIPLS